MTATEITPVEYRVLAHRMPQVHEQVAKANRKLAKLGLGLFKVNVLEIIKDKQTDRYGFETVRVTVRYTLDRPEFNKVAGWTFLARLDVLPDGTFLTAVIPGQELNGYRPDEQVCEHCGINRYRKATYLLRGENGEIKQVGSTCLTAFLGIEVKGLWALDWEPELGGDEEGEGGLGGFTRVNTPLTIVRAALAVCANGKGYVTRAQAEWGRPTTAGVVQDLLHPTQKMCGEQWFKDAEAVLATDENKELGKEVLEFAKNIPGTTDYATNLRAVANQEALEGRYVGLMVSAVAAWYRDKHEKVERRTEKAQAVNEWVGKEGDKVAGIDVTITGVRFLEGDYGTTTLLTFKDGDGRVFKWFASGEHNYDEGETVTIVRATIKKHDEYNGTKQTVLTRAKLEER